MTRPPPDYRPTGAPGQFARSHHGDQVYYLYLPPSDLPPGAGRRQVRRLLVIIHGQSRGAVSYARHFIEFADRHDYALLAPLFPPSMRYQELGIGGLRADLRLLELIDVVAARHALEAARFDLFGYSAGAQFAHRFLYVQPARLRSVVVGAPGTVTVPSERHRWPVGIRGLARAAGVPFDLEQVRRTRVLLVVGGEDVTLGGLNQGRSAMRTGTTRLGRARTLHAAWLVAGIEHEYVEVPDASHTLDGRIVSEACRFFAAGL